MSVDLINRLRGIANEYDNGNPGGYAQLFRESASALEAAEQETKELLDKLARQQREYENSLDAWLPLEKECAELREANERLAGDYAHLSKQKEQDADMIVEQAKEIARLKELVTERIKSELDTLARAHKAEEEVMLLKLQQEKNEIIREANNPGYF